MMLEKILGRSRIFPHLRLLSEETDAQNKPTENRQLEHPEYIYFSLEGKQNSATCGSILKPAEKKCGRSSPCF